MNDLKKLRLERGLEISDVAAAITKDTKRGRKIIRDFERGSDIPTFEIATRLSKLYEKSPLEIIELGRKGLKNYVIAKRNLATSS